MKILKLLALGVGLAFVLALPAIASAPLPLTPPFATKSEVELLISHYSAKYGVNEAVMRGVVGCESGGSTTIQSANILNGKREESYGLVQIHLPDHPEVTKEQAQDPDFALDFLAKNLKDGKGSLWTCHRNLYGNI